MGDLKLKIELVPRTSFGKSLRKDLGQYKWGKIRKKVYERHGNKCAVCGSSEGRLICHEEWEFQLEKRIQKLVGFKAVCTLCNLVIHNGLATTQPWVNQNDVVNHFLKVNGCTIEDWKYHREEAFERWKKLSQYDWALEYEGYEKLL